MSKKKQLKKNEQAKKKGLSARSLNRIFIIILIAFTAALYGITMRNYYNMDDYHIAKNNPDFEQGIKAIPKIFTTLYATENGLSYGYRPLVRTSFAIEYQFLGKNPYVSHLFNVIFYIIVILLLFKVLKRLLRNYHAFFPFIITLLFVAHPIHSEVVASLKNRDDLFVLIFCLLSLWHTIRYADTRKNKHIAWALLMILFSFLSKPTTAAFFMMFPLSLYFFTDLELKKIARLTIYIVLAAVVASFGPFLYLPALERPLSMMENPLAIQGGFINHIAYAGFTLFYYLKLLIFPHPLRYYYGYNLFPDISLSNIWVILGIILHLGLLVYAILKLKQKHILSYAILVYLTTIVMFANLVRPAPGILAERFLFIPSIAFCIILGYFIYRLFWQNPSAEKVRTRKLVPILALTILILIPYSGKTYIRNQEWRTEYSLYNSDMPYLYDSFKANDLYANEIMKNVNRELAKPVNVLKFVDPQIKEAISHWKRAIEILPDHPSPYNNLGMIYSRVYKEYDTAITYFDQSLKYDDKNAMVYFNLGQAYEGKKEYAMAVDYYSRSLNLDSLAINTRSKLANLYYGMSEFKKAIELNQEIMRIAPSEALPYVNLGNYYFFQHDTVSAIKFYERAVELNAPPEASLFLSKFYEKMGDTRKANHYKKISDDLKKKQEQGR